MERFRRPKASGLKADLVFAPVLHIGARAGAPWWDMWDPKILEKMDQVAREGFFPAR